MKISVIIGILVLLIAWIALAAYTFVNAGFNLHNLLVVGFSGIIIFVPIWKKYIKADKSKAKDR
ncbi:MAG: hypothetical protein K2H86_09505 [Muribaculaceae bacterium]|nr:hypothetical protein [Muribaculaceae bacterium]